MQEIYRSSVSESAQSTIDFHQNIVQKPARMSTSYDPTSITTSEEKTMARLKYGKHKNDQQNRELHI